LYYLVIKILIVKASLNIDYQHHSKKNADVERLFIREFFKL